MSNEPMSDQPSSTTPRTLADKLAYVAMEMHAAAAGAPQQGGIPALIRGWKAVVDEAQALLASSDQKGRGHD